jgi:hypothetical protein
VSPQARQKIVIASAARQSMRLWTTVDRFVPRDDAVPAIASAARQKIVIASAARQSMRLWTTVDRFMPRDDAVPVIASEARQSMDGFVLGDDGC